MDKELLKRIVLEQKENLKLKGRGFPRDLLSRLDDLIRVKHSIVITGHRRCGKSTLLLQIMGTYYKDDFYYLNFSDERLANFNTTDFEKLMEVFLELFGERKVFFFDEIQGVPNWQRFVNRMYENSGKFFLTGSNAELLSREISTFLTGRHLDIELWPFSFREFAEYSETDIKPNSLPLTKNKVAVIKLLDKYISEGGFPERIVYGLPEILQTIYKDVLNKDIIVRYGIRDVKGFEELTLFLISNVGKPFSYNGLKKNFSLGSQNTVKAYISYLCNSYLLQELNQFSYKMKQQAILPKKIYCIDTGMINALSFKVSRDVGRLYENLVFIELKRRGKELYYWKDDSGKETDFLVREKGKITQVIQVCFDLENKEVWEREKAGLLSSIKQFKLKEGTIITKDHEEIEELDGRKMRCVPIWKWLLSNQYA